MYLKILEEIKKSEKYSPKTHPIITLNNSEIFEEYYNYFIVNNLLFIVNATFTDIGGNPYVRISLVNPKSISSIQCPKELEFDISTIGEITESNSTIFETAAKDILQKLGTNPNNFGISYNKTRVTIGKESLIMPGDKIKFNGNLFSADVNGIGLENLVSDPGKSLVNEYRIYSDVKNIDCISVPLIEADLTPLLDYFDDDIKTMIKNYRNNKYGTMEVPAYKHQEYSKGNRVWVDVKVVSKSGKAENEVPEKRRYFVSKIDNNNHIPLSKEARENDAWLEYDPETNEAIGE